MVPFSRLHNTIFLFFPQALSEREPTARPPLAESRAEKLPLHFLILRAPFFLFRR